MHLEKDSDKNDMTTWSLFCNSIFEKIQTDYPEYLEDAAEEWMMTYNIQLAKLKDKDQKFIERTSAHAANMRIREFYKSLDQDRGKEHKTIVGRNDDNKEWKGKLADEEAVNKKYGHIKNKSKARDEIADNKQRKEIDRQTIFESIESDYPQHLDDAIELWNKEYLNSRADCLPEGLYDQSAISYANERLERFYDAIKFSSSYEPSRDKRKDTSKDDITEKIDSAIKEIEDRFPEHHQEALDYWLDNYERIRGNDSSDDYNAIKAANRRLKYFKRKLEAKYSNDKT
ncbi:MAG: hypothetical protein ACOCUR_00180 [Nanoarchaeota archaeon]